MNKILLVGLFFIFSLPAISVTRTWDGGGLTNNWNDRFNWSGDVIPSILGGDDVIFNGTSSKNCVINTSPSVISFTISSGYLGEIGFNSSSNRFLSITNFSQSAGTFNLNGTSMTVNGLFSLTGGSFNVTSTLNIVGDFDYGSGVFNSSAGEVVFLNNSHNITGSPNFATLTIDNITGGLIDFNIVSGSPIIQNTLLLTGTDPININGGVLQLLGDLDNSQNSGIGGNGSGTISFVNTSNTQSVIGNTIIETGTLPNIAIDKGTSELIFLDVISFGGNLDYTSVGNITLSTSSYSESILGFFGEGDQSIPSIPVPYDHLAVGGTGIKTLAGTTEANKLTLFNTDLHVGASPTYLRIRESSTDAITYNGPGKVIGTLERAVTTGTNYTYQVGLENGPLQRLDINFSSTGSDNEYVSIKFNDGSTINDSEVSDATEAGVTFDRVIQGGYWEINGNGTDETGAIYTVSLYPQGFSFGTEETYTVLKRKDLGNWEALGTPISDPEDHISSTVISRSNVTGFSNLGVGAASFVPTPVDLYSFHAKLVEDHVQLDWVTLSETKSSHFVIERSRDSHSFDSIGTVLSAGNSSERLEYNFADLTATDILAKVLYYRLKQVDVDGQSKTYPMVGVDVEDIIRNSKIKIFPNPATVDVTVASYLKEDVHLDIYNPLGKVVDQKEISSEKTTIDTSNLEAGVYVFKFINGSTVINKKVIVK